MFKKEFRQRLFFSSIIVILLVVYILLAPFSGFRPVFALTVAIVAGLALWEYYQLAQKKNFAPVQWLGIGWGVLYVIMNYLAIDGFVSSHLPVIVLGLAVATLFVAALRRIEGALASVAVGVFGLLYVCIPLSLFLDIIYYFPKEKAGAGQWWLSTLIAVTAMTDVGAFFTGKIFGKNKLAPQLSPGKTIEGAVGGLIAAVITSLVIYLIDDSQVSLIMAVVLGLLLGCVGQIGDLAESLLKRDSEVKDSNSLPGLGGVLDVVDSLLFNAPLVYLILLFFVQS
jgi:phosphatidate cytidylyltransferase